MKFNNKKGLFVIAVALFFVMFLSSFASAAPFACSSGTVDTTCYLNSTYFYNNNEIISGNGNLIINSTGSIANYTRLINNRGPGVIINFSTITVLTGGNISGGNITLSAINISILGGSITSSGLGYSPDTGPCMGTQGSYAGGGGGNGGAGGNGYTTGGSGGAACGSSLFPYTFGSGGRSNTIGVVTGGAGGGLISLIVSDTLILNGSLIANGLSGGSRSGGSAGGGAGGTIYVSTNTFSGFGNFSATGGNAGQNTNAGDPPGGGGGGGGRIAVYYNSSSFMGIAATNVSFGKKGNAFQDARDGGLGTAIFIDRDDNAVIIPQAFRFQGLTTIANETFTPNQIFWNSATPNYYTFTNVTILPGTTIMGDIENLILNFTGIFNNASDTSAIIDQISFVTVYNFTLDIPRYNSLIMTRSMIKTTGNLKYLTFPFLKNNLVILNVSGLLGNLNLNIKNLSLSGNSNMTSSSLGYAADNGPCMGTQGSYAGGGGGNGGAGGNGYTSGGSGGPACGSSLFPYTFGSGGRSNTVGVVTGGAGGGLISLIVSDTLILNGSLIANGLVGGSRSGGSAGGGSGGTIYVSTNIFSGFGNFSATGGSAGQNTNAGDPPGGGGGGGGRIAVYYNSSSFMGIAATNVSFGKKGNAFQDAQDGGLGTAIFIDRDDNAVVITHGFRFEGLTTVANEIGTPNQIFWNSATPNYYNFTNLTIMPGTTIMGDTESLVINITGSLNNLTAETGVIDGLTFTSIYNLTLDFPDFKRVYLNNSIIQLSNYLKFLMLPLTTQDLNLENSVIYANSIISVINLSIDFNSRINASNLGYPAGTGPGKGSTLGDRASGGGHGNMGGTSSVGYLGGVAYGSSLAPFTYGSGGGYYLGQNILSGSGGGIIKINSNHLILNGQILASGRRYVGSFAGGGSGGSIWVTTDTISGSGYLQSNGGNGMYEGTTLYAGGGSGGRIAVYYNQSTWTGLSSSTVTGGTSSGNYGKAEPGTFIISKMNENSVIISEGFRFESLTGIANQSGTAATTFWNSAYPLYYNFTNLSIVSPTGISSAYLYVDSENMVINTTNVFNSDLRSVMMNNTVFNSTYNYTLDFSNYHSLYLNNSILKTKNFFKFVILPFIDNNLNLENSGIYANLVLSLQNLSMDVNSRLDASYLGYSSATGPGAGSSLGERASGAGHGNRGGASSLSYTGGVAYGGSIAPTTFGSGGGYYVGQNSLGGTGGGIIKINSNSFIFNGLIYSNGQNYLSSFGGGGSGGSIWITTNNLSGSGYLQSNGGNGMYEGTTLYAGGGSGGRIAIYYNQSTWNGLSSSTVTGGTSSGNYGKAEPGTFIISKMNENSVIISEGFRFESLTGIANQSGTAATTFWNSAYPLYYNFTNLSIVSPTGISSAYLYVDSDNMVINTTNVFNSDLRSVMMNNTVFNSTYNYTLDFPSYSSLYLNNSFIMTRNYSRHINFPFLNANLNLENSGIYANLILSLQNLTISNTSRIDASSLGYAPTTGPGVGSVAGDRASGAGHGNRGGTSSPGYSGGAAYGSSATPFTYGSGGGYYVGQNSLGGGGGGIIKINSINLLLNGQILSSGQNYLRSFGGGGSGGSIWITTNNISGNGYLQANGGNGMYDGTTLYAGGGSGGRVAVYYNQSTWLGFPLTTVTGGFASGIYGKAGDGSFAFLQSLLGDYSFLNTPVNNSGFRNSFEINISLIANNMQNLIYTWNNTRYTLFDKNLLYLSFNNFSSLFENDYRISDAGLYENIAGAGRNYTSVERFFNFDYYGTNWTAVNLSYNTWSRGFAEIKLNSTQNPSIAKNITNFNSTKNNLELEYKSYVNGPNAIKLYYIDNTDCAAFSESCFQTFNIIADGDWHILDVPITDANWVDNDGLIDWIKLNFNGATSTSGSFYLDYIRFYSNISTTKIPLVVDGKYGLARQFDGVDDYLELEDHTSLNFRGIDFTLLAWVKLNSSGLNYVLDKGNATDRYSLFINNGKLNFQFKVNNNNITSIEAGNLTNDDSWHHLAVVFQRNGNALRYLDGNLIGTTDISGNAAIQNNPSSLFIGKSISDTNFFNGTIDEVYIFNKTLNAGEITNLYKSNLYKYNDTAWYFYKNQTDAQGIYSYSLSSGSEAFTIDSSDSRRVVLDFTNPNMTLLSLLNNTYLNNSFVNFSGVISDNLLIRNVSLYVNNILNQTINYAADTFTAPVGIVLGMVDGIYTWFFKVVDFAGNLFQTDERNLIVDTVLPLVNFTDPTPYSEEGRSQQFVLNVSIVEDNLANVSYFWNGTFYLFNQTSEYLNQNSNNTWTFTYNQTGLVPGNTYSYYIKVTDLAGNFNSTETRIVGANVAPLFVSSSQNPESNESLDPGTEVYVLVNISDSDYNIDSVYLEWKTSLQNWSSANRTKLENQSTIYSSENQISIYAIFNGSFTLPAAEGTIVYRFVANDTLGDSRNSSEYTLSSSWDCTWRVSPSSLVEVSGFYEDKSIGSFTLFNEGDLAYPGNCSLTFSLSRTNFNSDYNDLVSDDSRWYSSRRYLDFTRSISLDAGENQTISVLASFPSVTSALRVQNPSIEIVSKKEGVVFNDTVDKINTRNVSTTLFVLPSGPYLYLNALNSSINVYLTSQEFNLSAYVRNMGGDGLATNTAYNVSVNWTIPEILAITGGQSNYNFNNLSNSSIFQYADLTLKPQAALLETASLESREITITSEGHNISGGLIYHYANSTMINDTITVNFLCYPIKDTVCVEACMNLTSNLVYDPDCSLPPTTTTITTAGGGGGGGGGATSGSIAEKSVATYELLRGEKQEFTFRIENKYVDPMTNVVISVTGINAEYISISPSTIPFIAGKSYKDITVKINAPAYFTGKKYTLIFDILSKIVTNATTFERDEKKAVTLYILEVSREVAVVSVNESMTLLDEMLALNISTREIADLIKQENNAYSEVSFGEVKTLHEQIKLIYQNAIESKSILDELNSGIADAESKGVKVTETRKMLYLAQIAFNRGDYALALERLQQAKLVYALEVKGEFNLLYTIKNNPAQTAGITLIAGFVGVSSTLFIRYRLLKKKLRMLIEEEALLLELMKMVQRQCFEENRMSMEEYEQAMSQYENKLSETVEDKIRVETKITNILKIKGKKMALGEEKKRLLTLIMGIQDDYLNKNKIETRIYENMLKSYSSRLTEVDEQLAFMEAQDALKKEMGIRKMFKV